MGLSYNLQTVFIENMMMSRKITRSIVNYFKNPLVEGKFAVLAPPTVPEHIIKPAYVYQANPQFGIYEQKSKPHTLEAISKLRKAAQVASKTLQDTKNFILSKGERKEALTEEDIDLFVFESIVSQNAYPTPIGFMHFPKSVCVSVNECFVHGIPTTRPLDWGDKINIDVSVYIDGHHGDNNLTVFYGKPEDEIKQKVVQVTQKALYEAIAICKPGVPINQIGKAIQKVANAHKMNVCEQFNGHGVGHLLHMPPMIFHRHYPQYLEVMKVGHVFTIQPIITLKPLGSNIKIWKDNFTAISANNPNAQFEHTILIVEGGCQILTRRASEDIPNPNNTIKNV